MQNSFYCSKILWVIAFVFSINLNAQDFSSIYKEIPGIYNNRVESAFDVNHAKRTSPYFFKLFSTSKKEILRQVQNATSLEERYMSTLFAGGINSKTFDLTNEFIVQFNIFDYLNGRIAGLTIQRSPGFDNYCVYYRQSYINNNPVTLFLDEVRVDESFISSFPAEQFAVVKLFPSFIGAPGNNAALAFYTKNYEEDDMEDVPYSFNLDDRGMAFTKKLQ